MAERDSSRPQVNDPELEVDLQRTLEIVGPLGKLNVIDAVLPVVLMGSVRPLEFEVVDPAFTSGEIFSVATVGPAAGAVIVDTGALPAGTYDIIYNCNIMVLAGSGTNFALFEHRNAANTAALATWPLSFGISGFAHLDVSTALVLAANERLRVSMGLVAGLTGPISALIMARKRS